MVDTVTLHNNAQARHISKLREQVNQLQKENDKLRIAQIRDQQSADFYRQLQKAILENPTLQSEWTRFCSFLKLADVEFTHPEIKEADEYYIPFIGHYI